MLSISGADEHGGIRTNTTICLGKIASFLDPSKRQLVLLNAFTRGMKVNPQILAKIQSPTAAVQLEVDVIQRRYT